MFGPEKQKDRHTFAHNDPGHSLYKHSSANNLFLFVEPMERQSSILRHSQQSPHKQNTQPRNKVQYTSYPSIFRNKTTNIKKILKSRQAAEQLHKVLSQQKENKFTLILQHRFCTMDYYNTDYILSTNNQAKLTQKSFHKNITCRGATLFSAAKGISSALKAPGCHSKDKRTEKRKIQQRLTEPGERYLRNNMVGVSQLKKEIDISLSPW